MKDTKELGKGWFRAGLLLAPPELLSSPSPDGLDITLHHYEVLDRFLTQKSGKKSIIMRVCFQLWKLFYDF